MKIGLVYARSRNGVIGKDGVLPWHLPEDLAHFKRITMGHPVIMGRKTWESLPPKFRPLPGRRNIVVTRQADWQAEGASRASSLQDAIALCEARDQAWIIGGAQIFHDALPLAHCCEVTEIDADFEGDVFAPRLDESWHETARENHVSAGGVRFSFVTYTRKTPQHP
jgi:dihydrofolate reductase